jgi:DNA-binding MarR family transcriptional regulator
MSDLSKPQRETLERIRAAGFVYEGAINGLIADQLERAGLIERTHDPASRNWTLTASGHTALTSGDRK